MTALLHNSLLKRFNNRDQTKPWVFWPRYWSRKEGRFVDDPSQYRKKIMMTCCRRAGVRYFKFHALRHYIASVLEKANAPIGSIQRIPGHEYRGTTEIYLHSIGEAEREAMAVFEQLTQEERSREILTQGLTQEKKMGGASNLTP